MDFCRNCGAELPATADYCINCGAAKGSGTAFCNKCGAPTNAEQDVCLHCGSALGRYSRAVSNKKFVRVNKGKIVAGVFTGAEKCYGINAWLGRLIALIFVPTWPLFIIAYVILCTQTELVEE